MNKNQEPERHTGICDDARDQLGTTCVCLSPRLCPLSCEKGGLATCTAQAQASRPHGTGEGLVLGSAFYSLSTSVGHPRAHKAPALKQVNSF